MSADRNLLFGLLALQLDFIDRDQLIAGMQAWAIQKDRPLSEILQSSGALAPENRQLLEPLVERHIAQHNHDPQQSLAVLSSIGTDTAERLRAIADSEVEATVSVLVSPRRARRESEAPLVPDSETSGRFRVLRFHAAGGRGQVSVARDTELNRDVALKEIKAEYAADLDARDRFMSEAEITGNLEHPGIVPVYGMGAYADGRPFYAMRFIRGDSLRDGIRKFFSPNPLRAQRAGDDEPSRVKLPASAYESLEFRQLLGRFVDVCNAVAYAHARGVLHRDLKPGNIMLGKYGETLVVDWGLAKATGQPEDPAQVSQGPVRTKPPSSSSATMQGSALGTPAYMSPEQAAGKLDQLGPTTDIYSLGATLYQLLTGRPPFSSRATPSETLTLVQRGEFPPPLAISSTIPPPLSSICLKAMATEPGARYATALELAAEIEHYLADEPVAAHRDSLLARARRQVRRHRTLAAAGAATIAVAAVALCVILSVMAFKNRQLAASYVSLAAAQARVQARDRDARQAVQDFLTTVAASQAPEMLMAMKLGEDRSLLTTVASHQALQRTPGSHEVGSQMLLRAQSYCERFLKDHANDPELAEDRARVQLQLAIIDKQTSPGEDTLRLYESASEQIDRLHASQPDQVELLELHANAYASWADLLQDLNRAQEALAISGKGIGIYKQLVRAHPDQTAYQVAVARQLDSQGVMLQKLGRPREAVEFHQQANEIKEKLFAAEPKSDDRFQSLVTNLNSLGLLEAALGNGPDAKRHFERALDLLKTPGPRQLVAGNRYYLATILGNLAASYRAARQIKEARAAIDESLVILERLVQEDPFRNDYAFRLACHYENSGASLGKEGSLQKQIEVTEKSLQIFERLVRANPEDPEFANGLGQSLLSIGVASRKLKRFAEAESAFRKSAEIFEKLTKQPSASPGFLVTLAGIHVRLANLELDQKRPQGTLDWTAKAIAILQPLPAEAGRTAQNRNAYLMDAYWTRAEALESLDRLPEAIESWKNAVIHDPKLQYMEVRYRLAAAYQKQGDRAAATQAALVYAEREKGQADDWYKAASLYAWAANEAGKAKTTPQTIQERNEYAARALNFWTRAVVQDYLVDSGLSANVQSSAHAFWNQPVVQRLRQGFWGR